MELLNYLTEGEYMEHISWIFSGIGTEILIGIISLLFGGFFGYKKCQSKYRKHIQSQKAVDNAKQSMIGDIHIHK